METREMPQSTTERLITGPEQLAESQERLDANLARLNAFPEEVLDSPAGKEEMLSLRQRIGGKFSNFKNRMVEKVAYLGTNEGRGKMIGAFGVTMLAATVPSLIQIARTKWPEVGMALDAAPDVLQQVIHMDLATKLASMFTEGGDMWQNSGIEVSNLLADISSGKESVADLSPDQLTVLADGVSFKEDFDVLLNPDVDASKFAESLSGGVAGARAFGNMGVVAGAGIAAGATLTSVGTIASKFTEPKYE